MKFPLWSRNRTAAPTTLPPNDAERPAGPTPPPPEPCDSYRSTDKSVPAKTLDASPQALKPLAPLKPLASRPRAGAQAVDMAAATEDFDRDYRYAVHKALDGYKVLSTRYPHEPVPALKRMLAAKRYYDIGGREKSQKHFEAIATSPYDRATAWCMLFADRQCVSSHRYFGLTLQDILARGGAAALHPVERLMLLQDKRVQGYTLVRRALLGGDPADLNTVLKYAEPCREQLMEECHDLLDVALANDYAAKAAVLLTYGARPRADQGWERIAEIAAKAESPYLLHAALEAGLDANRVSLLDGAPWSLAQRLGCQRKGFDKLAVLAKFGGDLSRTPEGTRTLSVVRNQGRLGPNVLRGVMELGVPHDRRDAQSGNTPLMDMVQDGNAECIEPLLRMGANPHARRADGRTAYDIARASNDKGCLFRLERHADIAPYVADFSAVDAAALDDYAEALYRIPTAALPELHALSRRNFEALKGNEESHVRLLTSMCRVWPKLEALPGQVQERVLLRLRTNNTFDNADKVLKAFDLLPPQRWEALLDHQPWHYVGMHNFNARVMVVTAQLYEERGARALDGFILASYTDPRLVRLDQVGKVLYQFCRATSAGMVALRVADWGYKRHHVFRYHFQEDLQKRVDKLLTEEEFLINPELPDLPKRKLFFTLAEAREEPKKSAPAQSKPSTLDPGGNAAPKSTGKKKVELHPALEGALGQCPSVNVASLGNLESIKIDEIDTLISALQDPDVEDDIIDVPDSADATLRLIEEVLGPNVIDAIYADAQMPNVKPTRGLFLACHPDKVSEELKPVAVAMTQLLNTIRALISNEARGPYLSVAYARIRNSRQ